MIRVIDLYSGNPRDFDEALNGTFSGVIFKAGQGDWLDVPIVRPDWWKMAGDRGLLRGWYWVCDSRYHSSRHVETIKRWRDSSQLDLNAELGFWSDVEYPYIKMTTEQYWATPYAGHRNVVDFHYLLETNGISAGLYSADGVYNEIMKNAPSADHDYLADFRMWPANYPFIYIPGVSKPRMFGHWKTWTFWQYHGNPDYNEFNGTDAEFHQLFGGVVTPPPTGDTMNAVVLADKVNIRTDHNTSANDVGDLFKNQSAEVFELWETGVNKGWDYEQWGRIGDARWIAIWYRTQGKLCDLSDVVVPPPTGEGVTVEYVANGSVIHSEVAPAGSKVTISLTK